jgi:hypothetical protein
MLFEQQKNAAFSLYVQSGTGEMHHGKIHSLQSRALLASYVTRELNHASPTDF